MTVDQRMFRDGLLDPTLPAPAGLTDGTGTPTTKRFNVYRNNVAVSLTDALIAAFPVIHKLVGDEFFRGMAGVYLRTHLPKSPLMMYYGDQMPKFLMRFGPAKPLGYLPDVARLEIALRVSYHAADADPVAPDVIGALSPEDLMAARFTLAPSLAVLSSRYPIHGIWRANAETDAPQPVMRPENVLITRPGYDPVPTRISDAAAAFITALQRGDTLGVALTHAGNDLDLAAALGLLLRQNAITHVN